MNLVSPGSHGRMEYYYGKYFGKIATVEKKEDEVFNFLSKIANCKLVAKTSILSDHEKIVVILFCKIFPEIKKSWKICKRFLLFLKVNAFQKKYDCSA